ncbi:MAG: GNAT family N-acetyltransferase [Phycisphaerae bacterium]
MTDDSPISIRPTRSGDLVPLVEFLQAAAPGPAARPPGTVAAIDSPNRLVALRAGEVVGTIRYIPGAGHTAAVLPPRLIHWDDALAAALFRACAAHARRRHRARLIQTLLEPGGADPAIAALERAGFARLAMLLYMRRAVVEEDRRLPLSEEIVWRAYSRLRHRKFAETIAATYRDSLDCPGLRGLRTVHDAIRTHKHTGCFRSKHWHLAVLGRSPVGVVLVNELRGRGELVYLGVVPAVRGGGLGRDLVHRAIRETAEMGLGEIGLAVDADNTPAVRLYRAAGFEETHRRLAYFVPGENLDTLEE